MRFESLVGVTIIKCLSDLLKTEQQKIRLGLAGGGVGEGSGGGTSSLHVSSITRPS